MNRIGSQSVPETGGSVGNRAAGEAGSYWEAGKYRKPGGSLETGPQLKQAFIGKPDQIIESESFRMLVCDQGVWAEGMLKAERLRKILTTKKNLNG